jgi:hypothetical protein
VAGVIRLAFFGAGSDARTANSGSFMATVFFSSAIVTIAVHRWLSRRGVARRTAA